MTDVKENGQSMIVLHVGGVVVGLGRFDLIYYYYYYYYYFFFLLLFIIFLI